MSVPAPLLRRIEQLEEALARQQQLLAGMGRDARATGQRWVYLAKTKRVGGAYPAAGSNTFGLQFLDREFTPTEGTQAVTDHTRSDVAQAVGRMLDGSFVPEGTVVPVIPAPPAPGTEGKGRWHILPGQIDKLFLGVADGAIPEDGTGVVTRLIGGPETGHGASDQVENKWPAIDDGEFVIYGQVEGDGTLYVLAPSGGAETGVPFVNRSGFTVPPHGVMYPQGTELNGGISFVRCERPGTPFHHHWLVNGPAAVANNATGTGFWRHEATGPVAIQSAPLTAQEYGPVPGSFLLAPFRLGFNSVTESGQEYTVNGQAVADFAQRFVDRVLGKFYTQLTQGGTAEFEIWIRGSDGKVRPSGFDHITVHDWWLNKDEKVESGTRGAADWYSGYWEADPACDKDNTDSAQAGGGPDSGQQAILGGGQLAGEPAPGGTGLGMGTI